MKHFTFLIGFFALFVIETRAQGVNLPTTQLNSADCNSTVTILSTIIKANPITGATNYRFRFIKVGYGSDTLIADRPFKSLPLYNLPLSGDQAYNVDVAVTINGIVGDYGSVCVIATEPFLATKVEAIYCGIALSSLTSSIKADAVIGATSYRFRFINGVDTIIYDAPFRTVSLSNFALDYDKIYSVDVTILINGIVGSFGLACAIETPSSTTQLSSSYCGSTVNSMFNNIKADAVIGATNYRFRLINGVDTIISDRPFRSLPLSQVALVYATTYDVDVQVSLTGGITSDFGPVCQFTTPDFPITQLAPPYCGVTVQTMSAQIFAIYAENATNYRFRFIDRTDTLIVDRPYRSLQLSILNLNPGITYDIDIQVTTATGTGNYGQVCTVTTPVASAMILNYIQRDLAQEEEIEFETTLSPNPFSDVTTLHIASENSSSPVSVCVYDGTGRLIETRLVDLSQETDVRIGTDYNPGFYQVIIIQDGNKKTARIVKQ